MSERTQVQARVLFFVLVVANVLFFAYARISLDSRAAAASRLEDLQINPGRIRLMNTATRGPGGGNTAKSACLEWGPFAAMDAGRAEVALGRLRLPRPPVQRTLGEGSGRRFAYFVREPDAATVAQIAELQRGFPGTEIKAGPCPG